MDESVVLADTQIKHKHTQQYFLDTSVQGKVKEFKPMWSANP